MFFSKVTLSKESKNVLMLMRAMERNNYLTDQLIWELFPAKSDSQRFFLYRQEQENSFLQVELSRRLPIFYIVSEIEPIKTHELLQVKSKSYDPFIEKGMHLQFNIRTNPVIAKRHEGKKNSVKHDVLMDAKKKMILSGEVDRSKIKEYVDFSAISWLLKQGEQKGFLLNNPSQIEVNSYLQHKISKKNGNNIQFSSIDFNGILEVSDSFKFKEMLFSGLRHSKAFGCGLMLIKRI